MFRHTRKNEDVIDLSDTFLVSADSPMKLTLSIHPSVVKTDSESKSTGQEFSLTMGRNQLGKAQKSDASLTRCIEAAKKVEEEDADEVQYFWDKCIDV